MKMKFKAIASLAVVASAVMLTACGGDPDSSGYEYMPDMYRSPAIEPYVDYGEIKGREQADLKMKISALVPPHGAIAYRGTDSAEVMLYLPYHRLPNIAFKQSHGLVDFDFSKEDTYALAAADVTNPLRLTAENAEMIFAEGKELFKANCMHCHGEKGDGQGQIMKNGVFSGSAPDYKDKTSLSDGQMFYSIYYGKGTMGSHASILNKKEIWTLVHYIRKFQNPDYGKDGVTVMTAEPADSTAAVVK